VAEWLKDDGRVFFVDDSYRTAAELIYGEASEIVRRRLHDGAAYRIVKVPHRTVELEQRLRALGWDITVTQTSEPFFWGAGRRPPTAAR
jgi:demethylmenaquinone methyltransferase/2-methoxy-6-polyprenyl-1,4-benzoquinol methylase